MQTALDIGFTGVMYDGSLLPYEENLANTRKAVAMVQAYNCSVEAELDSMPSREDGEGTAKGPVYTDPDQAVEFCRATGIDALAAQYAMEADVEKAMRVFAGLD